MDVQRTIIMVSIAITSIFVLRQWNLDYYEKPLQEIEMVSRDNISHKKVTPYKESSGRELEHIEEKSNKGAVVAVEKNYTDIPIDEFDNKESIKKRIETRDLYKVKTEVFSLEFDLKTGNIVSSELLKYPKKLSTKGKNSRGVQLLVDDPSISDKETTHLYVAQSGFINTGNQGRPYDVQEKEYVSVDGKKKVIIEFYKDVDSVGLQKRYILEPESYEVVLEINVKNYDSSKIWEDRFYAQLKRDGTADPGSKDYTTPMSTYLGAAVKSNEKSYYKLAFDDFAKEPFRESVLGGYAAVLQHYFVSAWVPKQNEIHDYYTNIKKIDGQNYHYVGFQNTVSVGPGETGLASAVLYIGPKIQSNLKKLADGLDLTVDYGILWFIAQPIFKLLCWLQEILENWGWSIVLLTLIIKCIFYPLNAASFRSMARMRKLSPKIQELRERYGKDKQKMSLEMMGLYKKEKVNPMGGCLPILVQMPVFIALYWVLLEAVELRQAHWIFWIYDLSQIDPYFVLPLCMGVSMYVQQTLSPAPPDPTQAKVMKFMPVIFTVFFLWFPSGLVLYWLTNNILSITQQYMVMKQMDVGKS